MTSVSSQSIETIDFSKGPRMGGFAAIIPVLRSDADDLDRLARETKDLAVKLQGACQAPPKVGDVQAAVVYQQANYDWTQTRFEDLLAAEVEVTEFARRLRATADSYAGIDANAV
ncbi:hypothetical protein [Saccharothrix sp. NRRL B-16348]|uniref:hypothetical protein n=1 Tax=Saccharothrix sp. NRRL B-16348 TaxID=1415542 RepID=UPI000A4EB16D|nr:hypothetical protein [Saccharothrix sp. NRRL B-16348]